MFIAAFVKIATKTSYKDVRSASEMQGRKAIELKLFTEDKSLYY